MCTLLCCAWRNSSLVVLPRSVLRHSVLLRPTVLFAHRTMFVVHFKMLQYVMHLCALMRWPWRSYCNFCAAVFIRGGLLWCCCHWNCVMSFLSTYSPFQNYRRVGFLKYFKYGWSFLRIVFGILLRSAPQLLSYSF